MSHVQHWRRLLFAHWRVPDALLRPLIPRALAIDHFEGQGFVGLVTFDIVALRPPWPGPRVSLHFLETNVRTYVRTPHNEPGVYFLSLDAGSLLAVLGARLTTGLPYHWATGHELLRGTEVQYALARRTLRPSTHVAPSVQATYIPVQPLGGAEAGTLTHFLVERYTLHVQRGPALWSINVRHHPYPLQTVHLTHLQESLVQAAGLPRLNSPPDHLAYSSGVDVEIGLPRITRLLH